MKRHWIAGAALALVGVFAQAEGPTGEAALGGGIGGALGGAIGAELGGREGAIIGAGVGAAAGAAIVTRDYASPHTHRPPQEVYHYHEPHPQRFCPPGQAKKGRC